MAISEAQLHGEAEGYGANAEETLGLAEYDSQPDYGFVETPIGVLAVKRILPPVNLKPFLRVLYHQQSVREGWQQEAACRSLDPDRFLPTQGGDNGEYAKMVCATCKVRDDCREQSMELADEPGVWGGLGRKERKQLKQERSQARKEQLNLLPVTLNGTETNVDIHELMVLVGLAQNRDRYISPHDFFLAGFGSELKTPSSRFNKKRASLAAKITDATSIQPGILSRGHKLERTYKLHPDVTVGRWQLPDLD